MRLAKDVLLFSEFRVERSDAEILTAIKDGMFSKETIIKEIDEQVTEVEELLRVSKLPPHPSKDFINDTLFKIRGIELDNEITRIK